MARNDFQELSGAGHNLGTMNPPREDQSAGQERVHAETTGGAAPPKVHRKQEAVYSIEKRTVGLVEAAGVEPASEKVHRDKTTCVSDSVFFDHPMRNRQEGDGLA